MFYCINKKLEKNEKVIIIVTLKFNVSQQFPPPLFFSFVFSTKIICKEEKKKQLNPLAALDIYICLF